MRGSATGDAIASYQTDYLTWFVGVWRSIGPSYVLVNAGKTLASVTHIAFEAAARGLYAATDHAATIARLLGATSFVWLALELRRRSLVGLVVTSYVVFVCFWPWAPDRFVVPLLPLLAIAALTMLERALARVASHAIATGAIVALATSIVASNASLLASYSKQSGASGYPYFMPPAEPVTWASYEDAFTWLRENSDPDDVVVAGFDTMTALYTERRAVRPFVPRPDALFYGADSSPVGGVDDLAEVLASYRPRYLFLSPMPAFPEEEPLYQLVEHYVAARPGALTRAYVGSDPRFLVYEVNVRR